MARSPCNYLCDLHDYTHSILIAFQRLREKCLLLRCVERARQDKRRCRCPTLAPQERPSWPVRPAFEPSLCPIHCESGHTRQHSYACQGRLSLKGNRPFDTTLFLQGRVRLILVSYQHRAKYKCWALEGCCRRDYLLRSTLNKTHEESGSVNVDVAVATQEDILWGPAETSPLLCDTFCVGHVVDFTSVHTGRRSRPPRVTIRGSSNRGPLTPYTVIPKNTRCQPASLCLAWKNMAAGTSLPGKTSAALHTVPQKCSSAQSQHLFKFFSQDAHSYLLISSDTALE